MKTVTCVNQSCPQDGIDEFMCGDPDSVICGVCHEECELSELYDDPESCNWPPSVVTES